MTVYLVGAGPGDPGLMTVRGHALLQVADVILYDRLVAPELLTLAKPEAALIHVGKNPEGGRTEQETINHLLVQYSQEGKLVVRLKGGDPFVFGRGGEELLACKLAGVAVEVVPGVSSSIAVPAYAGVPVTHRNISTSFAVVTGHESPSKPESTVNYAALAALETLVFLMGVRRLPEIIASLIAHGRPAQTPAVCIEWGTYPNQRMVRGTLATIAAAAAQENFGMPALTIVGDVAALAAEMEWRKVSPLADKRVLLPRPRFDDLPLLLTAKGAWVVYGLRAEDKTPPDVVILENEQDHTAFTALNPTFDGQVVLQTGSTQELIETLEHDFLLLHQS